MGHSKFFFLEYNGKDDLAADGIDSWGGNHSYGTGEMTAMEDTWGRNWTSDIEGIQGRLIAE